MSDQPQFAIPIAFPSATADYNKQAVAVPGTERPGQTVVYRNSLYPLITRHTPGTFKNLVEIYDEGLRRSKGGSFLGHRPVISKKPLVLANYYVWQTWPEVDARRRALGSAMHKMFQTKELVAGDMETVGIWSINCPNWVVVDLAAQAFSKVTVALYDTLGADSIEHVINHAELSIVFAAPTHIPFLLTHAEKYPTLKTVVSLEVLDDDEKRVLTAWATTKKLKLMDIAEMEEYGRANPSEVITPTFDTPATICYTSGSSGVPKGAILSHGNLALTTWTFMHGLILHQGAVTMGFLPLAHIYERTMELCVVALGNSVGFPSGDPLRFLEDIQILRPHFVALVPRVLNRIYQAAMNAGDAPGMKGALFRRAVAAKLENMHTTGKMTHPLWDRVVFKKVSNVLGGRLLKIGSGSAPLGTNVSEFLKIALLADLTDGYGMTENGGCCTTAWPNDATSGGTVGCPNPTVEMKLVDVPQLGYRATDLPFPRGEICMRSDHNFLGYYKDEAKTRETIDSEGWLHTGDIGTLDAQGRFKVIDRVKNIMKLAQGEYVALEHIENVYAGCPLVAQLFVYGDGFQSYLVAILVPDPVQFAALVQRVLGAKAVRPDDLRALEGYAQDTKVVEAALKELNGEYNVQRLKGFEKVKKLHVTFDAFSVENDCLTPTLKIKRKEAAAKFKAQIDALYAASDLTAKM